MSEIPKIRCCPHIVFLAGSVFLASFLAAGAAGFGQRAQEPLVFERDVESAIATAQAEKAPYFLDFETTWCPPCRKMNENVYTAASVADAAQGLVLIKVDGDERPDLSRDHRVRSFPTGILYAADGKELARFSGYRNVKQMTRFFRQVSREAPPAVARMRGAGEPIGSEFVPLPWTKGTILVWQVGSPPGGEASVELLDFQLDAELSGLEIEMVNLPAGGCAGRLLDALANGTAPDVLLLYGLTGDGLRRSPDAGTRETLHEVLVEFVGALDYGQQFLVPRSRNHDRAKSWIATKRATMTRD